MTLDLPAGQVRALRRFIVIMVILAVIGGVLGTMNAFYRRYHPELPYDVAKKQARDPMSVVRRMTINGNELEIPVPYFKTFAPASGEQTHILLLVLYPDFSPLTESVEAMWKKGESYRNVMIHMITEKKQISLAEIYALYQQQAHATTKTESIHGLTHYIAEKPTWGRFYALPAPFEFVSCSGVDRRNPQCTMIYAHSGVIFKVSFDDELLPEWRVVRESTADLFDHFAEVAKNR